MHAGVSNVAKNVQKMKNGKPRKTGSILLYSGRAST